MISMMGSKLTRKMTFLTRKLFLTIEPVALIRASLKKNQGNIPQTSQRINGKSPTGFDLKPT